MISHGLVVQQDVERRFVQRRRGINGAEHPDQLVARIVTPLLANIRPSKDLGPRPEVQWLSKALLSVDSRYQRQATSERSRRLIRKIVQEFCWAKFQPITVAALPEQDHPGRYAVIDGQHRALAALAHPGVAEVPCWIVDSPDVGGQARVFVSVNRDRANIQALQLYRAQLAAHDGDAIRIDEILKATGITVAYSMAGNANTLPPRQTQAVVTIKRLLSFHGDVPVTIALKALVAAYHDTPGQLRGQVIEAVTNIVAKYDGKIDSEHLSRVLAAHDCEELASDARGFRKLVGGRTSSVLADALIKAYNKSIPPGSGIARLGTRKTR